MKNCLLGKIVLFCCLAIALSVFSCKKQTPAAKSEPKEQKQEQPAVREPAAQTDMSLEPIPLELPKPMFVGTPENIQGVERLEKPIGKARPPFLAPKGTNNVALNKPVTGSDPEPIMGRYPMITDGDKDAADGSCVEMGPFKQWVQIDLEQNCDIYAVVVWHYHKTARVYFDVIVQVSQDPEFITDVKTIFNNDMDNSSGIGVGEGMHYVETAEGRLIDAKGTQGRYVRLYSNGNNSNDLNHYIEVDVYGKKAQ